jgi:hypothetical protein
VIPVEILVQSAQRELLRATERILEKILFSVQSARVKCSLHFVDETHASTRKLDGNMKRTALLTIESLPTRPLACFF